MVAGIASLTASGIFLAGVSVLSRYRGTTQQTPFSLYLVCLHAVLGLGLLGPSIGCAVLFLVRSWSRTGPWARGSGVVMLSGVLSLVASGLFLLPVGLTGDHSGALRVPVYRVHWLAPPLILVAIRPTIGRRRGRGMGALVAAAVALLVLFQALHARSYRQGPLPGEVVGSRFFPSEAATSDGGLLPAASLMKEDCRQCHPDAYKGWFHSSHHFSSFNNPAYRASVRETRKVALERDGNTRAARWCAGCHDPLPLLSGEFEDPNYDDVTSESSQAGITCTVCHAIKDVRNTRGNAAYTIEVPPRYPFAGSTNPLLARLHGALIKAKPELHKATFLKPVIKDVRFCSTCHKVGIPYAVNHDKEFIRGQNHYDAFRLSGASGRSARSFSYPPRAKGRCIDCHMNSSPRPIPGLAISTATPDERSTTTSSSAPIPRCRRSGVIARPPRRTPGSSRATRSASTSSRSATGPGLTPR